MRLSLAKMYSVALLLLIPATSPAQKRAKELPASAYQLVSVTVSGSEHFKSEDIVNATGMQIGHTVHDEDLKDAARVLGDSGAFADVGYSFEYSPEGTKVQWKLKDAADFVPARFENFVWFSDEALIDAVHTMVPLFHGELPARGRLADQVSEALQALLAQKNVPGSVDYVRLGPDNGPTQAFDFSISGLHIEIRNVDFTGAGASELPLLQSAAEKLEGTQYLRSALSTQVQKLFVPVYLHRGYLKAEFQPAEAKVVESNADRIDVDATFAVVPGPQYKLSEIVLKGNRAVPTEDLQKIIHLPLDQPADAVQLDNAITTIKQLYGAQGYVAASIKSQSDINDASSTVRYVLEITEGPIYKMGELEILGLDQRTAARLRNDWTLRAGDTYDAGYAQRFLNRAYKEIGDWNTRVEETQNQDHTVDVTLRFQSR